MTRVILSQLQGSFAQVLSQQLTDAGIDLAPDGASDAFAGAAALIVTDLVDDLMVASGPATTPRLNETDMARAQDMIRAAAAAGVARIVLISAADYPPNSIASATPLVSAAVRKLSTALEATLAEVAPDRAVVLRCADVIDPAAPNFKAAVQALVEGGSAPTWPFAPLVQGIGMTDLAAACVAAVQIKGISGNWYDIVLPEAVDRASLVAESQRLAHILTDPDLTEIQQRPDYGHPIAPRDGSALSTVLRKPARKSLWTMVAQAVQHILQDGVAAGKIAPLVPPMVEIHRALETGALPFAGKVAVLTGATAGIGRAMVPMLVQLGAQVVGIGRNAAAGQSLADEISGSLANMAVRQARLAQAEMARSGTTLPTGQVGSFRFVQADLAELAQVKSLAARLVADYPQIEILINNAAAIPQERTETSNGTETTLAINLVAPVTLTRLLANPLKAAGGKGWAKIINVVSDAHFKNPIEVSDLHCRYNFVPINAYGRSKSGLVMLTRAFATQMAPLGISIIAVSPGLVRTDMLASLGKPLSGGPTAQQRQKQMRERAMPQALTPTQSGAHVIDVLVSPTFAALNGEYVSTDYVRPAAPPYRRPRANPRSLDRGGKACRSARLTSAACPQKGRQTLHKPVVRTG